MAQKDLDLGAAELEVLRVLWDADRMTVRDVLTTLTARGRILAYTTVQTFLNRLELKGFVVADKSETPFRYRAKVSRERVSRNRLRTLLAELYDGAAGPLVLHLVKNERLTADEVDALQKLIDRLDSK